MNGTGAPLFASEQSEHHLLTCKSAQIMSGFISFGTLHIHTEGFEPWQW